MSLTSSRPGRRLLAVVAVGALSAAGLAVAAPAQAATPAAVPATSTGSGPSYVDDATFTWGVSGYAQQGVFGAWTFKDLTGNAASLDGATQTEYVVAPQPATSMPAGLGRAANAVRFTAGTGVIDETTGAGTLAWDGSYTVNAYPPQFNAPDEIYANPKLTVNADGSGTLSAEFTIGAGTTMGGDPFEAQSFGRLAIMTFDAGSLSARTTSGYRVTPDYQGVTNGLAGQTTACSTDGGATGWWGSWPTPFVSALDSHPAGQSVLPHFHSTGCGGAQDKKPPLPFDVTFDAEEPTVEVSNTRIDKNGSATITVTGSHFHPSLAEATRQPICASAGAPCGKSGGSYVVFGKFAENWRPSLGASSANRKAASVASGGQKWAVPAASYGQPGLGAAQGAVLLGEDGDFTAELTVDKATLDAAAGAGTEAFRYGIYTYPGSGAVAPAFETFTPITFYPVASTVAVDQASYQGVTGTAIPVQVEVSGSNSPEAATGEVALVLTPDGGAAETVDTADLSSGAATLEIPGDLPAGSAGTLSVEYAGDDLFEAGASDGASYAVTKAAATVEVTGLTSIAYRSTHTYTVRVTGGTATGTVTMTRGGATQVADLVDGTAKFLLPAPLPAGTRTLTFAYSGDAATQAATAGYGVTIRKGASATVVRLVRSATTRVAGTFRVRVSSVRGGPAPAGTVRLVLTKGSIKRVMSPRRLTRGTALVTLPRLSSKGLWTLRASYSGGPNHGKSVKVRSFRVR